VAEGGKAELESAPERQETPTTPDMMAASGAAPGQTPEPAKPRGAVNPRDDLVCYFSSTVVELIRITAPREAQRFRKTTVPADDLARLGKLLTDLASLKKSCTFRPTATVVSYGNTTVSPEQSAEDMKAKHEALEARGDAARERRDAA
jgi:hypothetical protein